MPSIIQIAQRVIVNVGVTIQRLRVPRLGHQGIGLQEAAQGGVVEAGPVIIQAQRPLPPLAGEAAVGEEEAALPPEGAMVRQRRYNGSGYAIVKVFAFAPMNDEPP